LNEVTRGISGRASVQSDPKLAAEMRAVARPTPGSRGRGAAVGVLPYYNAQMRTTCVATRLFGGHAQNALPQLATANVNCRILPAYRPRRSRTRW